MRGFHRRWKRWQPTEAQRRVLNLLILGKTNVAIANELGLSAETVKWHVSEMLGEVGLHDRKELSAWWQDQLDRPESSRSLVLLAPRRLAMFGVAASVIIASALLLFDLRGQTQGGGPDLVGIVYPDVGVEEEPTVQSTIASSSCPAGGQDLHVVSGTDLQRQGYVWGGQLFSPSDCSLLVAVRDSRSFVRLPSATKVTLRDGEERDLPPRFAGERYSIDLEGEARTVVLDAATRYSGPGTELAVSSFDEQGRPYGTAVDSNGGLWIHANPVDGDAVINYWTGDAVDVSNSKRTGKLEPEGQFRFTSCDEPNVSEPCGVSYRPLDVGLHAPAAGTVRCLTGEELGRSSPVGESIIAIELDTGSIKLRFERLHTGLPWMDRAENCETRDIHPGDLIGNHYHYWIEAVSPDGSPLSVGITEDGTLVVGEFRPTTGCPCIQGN